MRIPLEISYVFKFFSVTDADVDFILNWDIIF